MLPGVTGVPVGLFIEKGYVDVIESIILLLEYRREGSADAGYIKPGVQAAYPEQAVKQDCYDDPGLQFVEKILTLLRW
jgi:hypothetical protein